MYNFGDGTSQNIPRAIELYERAAEGGHGRSAYNAGVLYAERTPPDVESSIRMWEKAAKLGDPSAQCALGMAYQYGEGVPKSHERAAELYKLAKEQDFPMSYSHLSGLYMAGQGVKMSYSEARRLARMALKHPRNRDKDPTGVRIVDEEIQRHCPLLGHRVVLHGLSTAALNGKLGKAVDWACTQAEPRGRYQVKVDEPEGKIFKVKPVNVKAASGGGGGGGGGAGGTRSGGPSVQDQLSHMMSHLSAGGSMDDEVPAEWLEAFLGDSLGDSNTDQSPRAEGETRDERAKRELAEVETMEESNRIDTQLNEDLRRAMQAGNKPEADRIVKRMKEREAESEAALARVERTQRSTPHGRGELDQLMALLESQGAL